MLIGYKRGQGSVVLRIKILNSSVSTGAGLTGLTSASSGLIISSIADNEATATAYTVAGSTIETITTLGTYAAPTATKCRFKEVDATNHKGVYEIQIADARFAVSSAKSLLVSISGATNAVECDVVVPLRDLDPYDAVRAGLTAMPNAAAAASGGLPTIGATIPNATAGASGGLFIAGTNAATTISGLTTGALSCTTITASGAVAFQSTFAVTTSTSLAALSCTTLTASGAVAFQSTLGVTGTTTFAAINTGAVGVTTFASSGTTTLNALTVTNATTLSGAVSLGSTLGVTGATTLAAVTASGTVTFNAFTCTDVFTVSGATTLTGAVTASNASNNIVGVSLLAGSFVTATFGTCDLTSTMKASVNTEVLDVIAVDTTTQPAAVLSATPTIKEILQWLGTLSRNKRTQSTATETLYANDGSTTIATSAKSDASSLFTRGEWV